MPSDAFRVAATFEQEYPGASASATECLINLYLAGEATFAHMTRYLREQGLPSLAAFVTLEILRGAREPLPPHVISQRLFVTRGTVTGVLDTLEQHGLVRRLAHPDDRRKLLIEITEPAVRLLDDLLPRLHRLEREWLDCLSPSEQETLVQLLGRVRARLLHLATPSAPAPATRPPGQPTVKPARPVRRAPQRRSRAGDPDQRGAAMS